MTAAQHQTSGRGSHREGRDQTGYGCVACGQPCHTSTLDGMPPTGWYRLKISGPFDERDVRPGSYCTPRCLLIGAAVAHFGTTIREARAWLDGADAGAD